MILTWWHSSSNEVYPWSPLVKDKDRANVHIYSLIGNKIELLCYYRTEFDQVSVNFSRIKSNSIWLLEQKVSKKGDVTVEYSCYEVTKNVLHKVSITSIPLQTQVCCHSLSPDEEKLILGKLLSHHFHTLLLLYLFVAIYLQAVSMVLWCYLTKAEESRGWSRLLSFQT